MAKTMNDIEILTKRYADARARLGFIMGVLERELREARARRIGEIKRFAAETAEAREALSAAIEESGPLFGKPRSRLFHGIRVGLQKGKGEIAFDDADQVVKLIKKHLADEADALIKVTERPIKTALAQLSAAELKKIGVTVQETGDQVLIKVADSEIDKLVDALLAEDETPERQVA